jgi:hypothetical protein
MIFNLMKKLNNNFFSCLFTLTMLLFSGSMMAQTFNGGGNPQSIPVTGTGGFNCAGGPTTSIATASGLNAIDIVESVTINLTHSWDSDLDISLVAPSGASIDLSSDNGSLGDNYTNTIFMDGAPSITGGTAPFTGTYSPEQPLSTFR